MLPQLSHDRLLSLWQAMALLSPDDRYRYHLVAKRGQGGLASELDLTP